ncbi:hypothetical protein MOQ_005874 [Trypanosoma cruzi marinkellei]|uniref:Uncharacterized protein n=1 Tax=Trypanosoma cruzi marinkellei TaxID=85056 RepID=K2NN77_TRYCR|nr:hypothetical protein MOQ_005874 [Trypanosoma cruzi marinkellei]
MPFCNVKPSEVSHLQNVAKKQGANDVATADHTVLLVENMMRRYVEGRSSVSGSTGTDKSTSSLSPSWFDAVKADEARMARTFPYPSLFLHPLPLEMSEHPDTPSPRLLATETAAPVGGDSNTEDAPRREYREMFALNGGASEMVTVLQGECGLAVVSPRSRSTGSRSVYLLSPDATSCTIVACRVGLHSHLRERLMAAAGEMTDSEDGALAWRCCKTFTAAMGHFDYAQGVVEALYEMLWESALPAWFHAALRDGDGAVGESGEVGAALGLLERLRRIAQTTTTTTTATTTTGSSDFDTPMLVAEWFVVGGVRSREKTLPVLNVVLRTLFAAEEQEDGGANLPGGKRSVLKPSFHLSEVLNGKENDGVNADLMRIEHRLREDGVCFWSLNTVLRQWSMGRAGELYSCPASLGLLVDVGGGCCWPATVQPGTRNYPLAALRHVLMQPGYRWTCPLEREGTLRVRRGAATARAASYFGLQPVSPTESVCSVTLAAYVAAFLHRCEDGGGTEEERASVPLPILVRRGVWEKMENIRMLDDLPDSFFLMTSTTPHCEPSDFAALGRQRLGAMSEFCVDDVFAAGTVGILV